MIAKYLRMHAKFQNDIFNSFRDRCIWRDLPRCDFVHFSASAWFFPDFGWL